MRTRMIRSSSIMKRCGVVLNGVSDCAVTKRQEDDVDEWKELAAVVGSRYISAAHLYPAFAATVARQNVSPSALLLCLIYIDRLHDANPSVNVDHFLTSSDLFIVSLMSACKFLYDVGEVGDCYNGTWARDFGIPIKHLNKLEFLFLDALQWNLHADSADFDAMMHNVESEITHFGCQFRDYLTYSDLLVLSMPGGFSVSQ
ncbi:protein CNPPD1-like [Paramacrobiotus metropolitanus]|uniref:protein CNPPD1-like n=1 Tax=Paramacrobiotus metropolitanus TaxID=2943436 RepID=UPI002445B518|nr:protein CNPPD1-like [Paramacrobiotus metropolitanus]